MVHAPASLPRRVVGELRRLPLLLKLVALLALIALPSSSCTCANVEYSRAYKRIIEEEVEDYVHQGEVATLWSDVDTHLSGLGYVVPPPPEGRIATLETEWRSHSEESRDKVEVELTPAAGGGHQTRISVVREAPS